MAGGDAVMRLIAGVAEAEVLAEIALSYEIGINAEGDAARQRPVEPFATAAGEIGFQIAAVEAEILVLTEPADVGCLQVGHSDLGGR